MHPPPPELPDDPPLPVRQNMIKAWQPQEPVLAEAAAGIRYLGHSPAEGAGRGGEAVELVLHWQSVEPVDDEYLLRVDCVDAEGVARLLHLAQPIEGRWPTRAWDPGDIVYDRHWLDLPSGMAQGRYSLRASWVDLELEPAGPWLTAGTLHVAETRPDSASAAAVELPARLGYRQSAMVTRLVEVQGPGDLAQATTRLVSEANVWPPLATEIYPAAGLPTSGGAWVQRDFYPVTVGIASGSYELWAEGASLDQTVTVRARERQFVVPTDFAPLEVRLGERIGLRGYRLEGAVWSDEPRPGLATPYPTLRPGDTLNLLLAWTALDWIPQNYTVFTHLIDDQEIIRGQHDQVPQFDYSTLFWVPGEVVVDLYHLSLPEDAPEGVYQIRVGMYEKIHNTRLPVGVGPGGEDTSALGCTQPGCTAAAIASVVVLGR